jgi:type IV secretion system protein VirB4
MGGDFFDLTTSGVEEDQGGAGGNEVAVDVPLGFQPLAALDTDADRTWAAEWAAALMEGEGVRVDAARRERIWAAINSLAAAPKSERTISGLHHLLQDKEAKEALAPFCVGGPFGGLFDAQRDPLHQSDADLFNAGRWQAFEMEELMTHPRAVAAALGYLFHALDGRFTGSPTLLVLDEAWLFLDHPLFRTKIREWLKVLRKRNVAVVFATQSLADVGRSDIAPAILENCLTRILLPNAAAAEPTTREVYERLLGLNPRQMRLLATAIPKRHYYYSSVRGNRLIDLDLSRPELALVAASTPADQAAARRLLHEVGRHGFLEAWLRRVALRHAADDAAEAGRAAARLMAFDAGTEAAIDAAASGAAEAMRDRILNTLTEQHPEAADCLRSMFLPPQDEYPNPAHVDVPPHWREALGDDPHHPSTPDGEAEINEHVIA